MGWGGVHARAGALGVVLGGRHYKSLSGCGMGWGSKFLAGCRAAWWQLMSNGAKQQSRGGFVQPAARRDSRTARMRAHTGGCVSQPLSRLAHVSSPAAPSRFYVQPMLLPLLKEMPAGQLGVDLTCRATQLVTMGGWQGVDWVCVCVVVAGTHRWVWT